MRTAIDAETQTSPALAASGVPKRIDLNADVGEGHDDAALYPLVSSINIACGAHAGDEDTISRALDAAATFGLAAGAHPSYADRENMGRVPMSLAPDAVTRLVRDQVRLIERIAERLEVPLCHVKPHGALYNQAAAEPDLARAIAEGVQRIDPMLRVVGLAGSVLLTEAAALGLSVAGEGFADRRYMADGTLAPRSIPDAVITDPGEAADQAVAIAEGRALVTVDGEPVTVDAQTICVHGDTPGAVEIADAVRQRLIEAGFEIAPL